MRFRVTATVGRDTTDRDELHAEADRLDQYFLHGPVGGAAAETPRRLVPDVLVDPASAALIVATEVDEDNALMAAMATGGRIVSALMSTGLPRPTNITSIEAKPAPS